MTEPIVIRFALLNDPFYWALAAMAAARATSISFG